MHDGGMAEHTPRTPPGGSSRRLRHTSNASVSGSHRAPTATLVRVTRPVAGLLAGRRWFPLWAVLHHHGRKSGKEYAVPVAPLVSADVGCTIRWKGVDYRLSDPHLVGVEAALRAAGPFQRRVLRRTRIPAFLELRR